ncbi:MAG TPA: M20/M25/M40 family metallo-hydrolase [Thermoanaerobaculia bacterium]|nr:M20/M25/M40 family metallo-hydrolase [Thermoanaerobaculia bacterium]
MTGTTPTDDAKKRRHRKERIAAGIVVLICLLAAAGAYFWSAWMKEDLRRDLTYIPREVPITPEIRLLQEFVRIDTSTPAGAAQGARWIARYLEKHGIRAELIASAPDRLNVYARVKGKRAGGALLLFNHIDVMPPGDGWKTPPFSGGIATNVMYGRGTLDMKALTVCQLVALVDVVRSGRPPERDLIFLATADEETGSEYGMRWLIANRGDVFEGVEYGITEGGITEMMSDGITYFGIEVGGKQVVELTLEAADAGPLRKARIALEPHMFPRDAGRIMPEVREYMKAIAPTRLAFRPYLADIDKTIRNGDFWRLPAAYRDLTQTSLWVYEPEKNGDRWTMFVRMANLPDESPDARIAWLSGLVRPYGIRLGEVRTKEGPVPISPTATPFFRVLTEEASRRYRVTAGPIILYRSATDSRFLRPLGITCYGISPYPVDYFQSLTIHKANERIGLDRFMEGVGYVKSVVSAWSQHP